jgi:hypothetical protein
MKRMRISSSAADCSGVLIALVSEGLGRVRTCAREPASELCGTLRRRSRTLTTNCAMARAYAKSFREMTAVHSSCEPRPARATTAGRSGARAQAATARRTLHHSERQLLEEPNHAMHGGRLEARVLNLGGRERDELRRGHRRQRRHDWRCRHATRHASERGECVLCWLPPSDDDVGGAICRALGMLKPSGRGGRRGA